MDMYQATLFGAVAVTVILAWNLPRAVIWIALMAVSFVASSHYWMLHNYDPMLWVYPAMFAGLCDTGVVLTMHRHAALRWEMRLANIVHAMIAINVLWQIPKAFNLVFGRFAEWMDVSNQFLYGALLDVCNWGALAMISGTAIIKLAGADNGILPGWLAGGLFGPVHRYLFSHRKNHPA